MHRQLVLETQPAATCDATDRHRHPEQVLEDKTESLAGQSQAFQRKAVVLRRNMWWRNWCIYVPSTYITRHT